MKQRNTDTSNTKSNPNPKGKSKIFLGKWGEGCDLDGDLGSFSRATHSSASRALDISVVVIDRMTGVSGGAIHNHPRSLRSNFKHVCSKSLTEIRFLKRECRTHSGDCRAPKSAGGLPTPGCVDAEGIHQPGAPPNLEWKSRKRQKESVSDNKPRQLWSARMTPIC